MKQRQVVVTGIDAITSAGTGVGPLWRAVTEGEPAGEAISAFDVSRNASRIGAPIPDFDPLSMGLEPADVERMDRSTQLAVISARRATEAAGLAIGSACDPGRIGVAIGTAIGGVGFMEREFRRVCRPREEAKPRWVEVDDALHPETYGGYLALSVSSEIATDLGFHGPVTTMATGCTAGLDAIGAAASLIEAGLADVVVTGGVDASLTPIVLTSFDNIKALSRRNGDPRRASRPFDRERDGFLLAEGCGILVLEEAGHARRRGARIHGQVLGFASQSNAYHMTGLNPEGEALASTLWAALGRARVNVDEVDYINAHGSSTQQNDRNETGAFKRAFGERAYRIPISSSKSVLGHSLGAASAIETIVCLLALERGVVPLTANYETPCPDCDLDYVPKASRDARLEVVECNASGFSGIHSSLIVAHESYRRAS